MIRVYKFGLRRPSGDDNLARIEHQLRAAHQYANDLVQIERARRAAVRACEASPEVDAAMEAVRQATKSTRKAALLALRRARATARAANEAALKDIADKDHELRLGLRALTKTFWGSYLLVEASADQARKMLLYADDGLTPADPRFKSWRGIGQLGVQIQKEVSTADAFAGRHTFVQVTGAEKSKGNPRGTVLRIRVGSANDRTPVWAEWPIVLHRAIPDGATWKKVTVTSRQEGPPGNKPKWSCEITLDLPGEHPHELAVAHTGLSGTIAVEVAWDKPGDHLAVAYWQDDRGERSTVIMPQTMYRGVREIPDGIRSVRDQLLNNFRPQFQATLQAWQSRQGTGTVHPVLARAVATCLLWKSPGRFHELARSWRTPWHTHSGQEGIPEPYALLRAWELRDIHLWQYESGARGGALRRRLDWYRNLAATWSRQYQTVILDDRDLTREARWGEASDLRFTACPFELRQCLRHAFGTYVFEHTYKQTEREKEEDDRSWCERALAAHAAVGARSAEISKSSAKEAGGAWRKRKLAKAAKHVETEALANRGATAEKQS